MTAIAIGLTACAAALYAIGGGMLAREWRFRRSGVRAIARVIALGSDGAALLAFRAADGERRVRCAALHSAGLGDPVEVMYPRGAAHLARPILRPSGFGVPAALGVAASALSVIGLWGAAAL